jgi:transposase
MAHKQRSKQGNLSDWMMPDHAALHALDGLETVVDWSQLEGLCAGIYASKTGRPSTPIAILLRALLLGAWYGLSDVKLEAALVRDLLFRKFCGLAMNDTAPDHSTLSRFRSQLVEKALWERIFDEVNQQLMAQHIIITQSARLASLMQRWWRRIRRARIKTKTAMTRATARLAGMLRAMRARKNTRMATAFTSIATRMGSS